VNRNQHDDKNGIAAWKTPIPAAFARARRPQEAENLGSEVDFGLAHPILTLILGGAAVRCCHQFSVFKGASAAEGWVNSYNKLL
jgi:hypothetical protein